MVTRKRVNSFLPKVVPTDVTSISMVPYMRAAPLPAALQYATCMTRVRPSFLSAFLSSPAPSER